MRDDATFEGGVFSAEVEGGRAGATLSLSHEAVLATTAEGLAFRLPYADCQLELGGASGKMYFCRAPDRSLTLFTEAHGFAVALQSRAPHGLGRALAQLEQARARRQKRALLLWLGLAAALLAMLVGGYLGVRHAGRAAVMVVPASVDAKLGELALDNMDLGGPLLDDPVLRKAVATIVARLSAAQRDKAFHYQVRIVDAPTVNAFALPGGFIVVYTGLLRTARGPEMLAGVLAHEMAHVSERHGLRRIAQSVGVIAAIQLLFGDLSGLAAVAVEALREGAINSYSRDQEREADAVGVETLALAHVDPRALAQFFALLDQTSRGSLGAVAWLGTHPELPERIATVERLAARRLVTAQPLAVDWDAVARHAGRGLPEGKQGDE